MKTTARLVYDELSARDIDVTYTPIGEASFFTYSYGGSLRMMSGVCSDLTSATARTICNNKDLTAVVAANLQIAMPATITHQDDETTQAFLVQHQTVVVKPTDSAHGNGVTTNITTVAQLEAAIERARQVSPKGRVILQQQVSGSDYRVLVIDGRVVAAAERVPAAVVGDGVQTIAQLIEEENRTNPRRGANYEKPLNYIDREASALFLGEQLMAIPAAGETVAVVGTANIGTGGKSINRTDVLPDAMKREAEQVASAIGAFVCGVDFMYDPSTDTHYLIELNSSPSFGLHQFPSEGEPVNVAQRLVDSLLAAYDQPSLTK